MVNCVHIRPPASTVYSVLRSVAVQNILCWLACCVHNRPPSPKFQILPSQLRQTADRAAGLSIKGLWVGYPCILLVQISRECTPPYLSTGILNLLQPAQAEVVLGQLSAYLASWGLAANQRRRQPPQLFNPVKFFGMSFSTKFRTSSRYAYCFINLNILNKKNEPASSILF